MRLLAILLLALPGVFAAGCGSKGDNTSAGNTPGESGDGTVRVTATVGMVADLVREVGGDRVTVQQICGSGVDPHLYKPTRDDVRMLSGADVVFYSGLMLEGKMSDTLVKMAGRKSVTAVTEVIDPELLLEPEDMQGHYDPHVWMDVSLWSRCADVVRDGLTAYDPEGADTYAANAKALRARLEKLHEYGRTAIASVPESSRVLITSHDAFNYLGRAYGLDVQGVQGLSTESEAGLQRVGELVDLLVRQDVGAVFVESSVPRKSIDSLIEGARSRGHEVVVGGELYSDAMGPLGTYEGTYEGMLDHNLTTIAVALGGDAPAGGSAGRLNGGDSASTQSAAEAGTDATDPKAGQ